MTAGPVVFARYAYPPNALGYCGPADSGALLKEADKHSTVLQLAPPYHDVPGFCKSTSTDEIVQRRYTLTPGRYVGAEELEDEGEPFEEKMTRLVNELNAQFAESANLERTIHSVLETLAHGP